MALLKQTLGEVLALMGPSGSGKTTLLNILAGRSSATSGTVAVNNAHVPAPVYKKLTSFVEQEDALVGSLTVRETLDFAARLALPRYAYNLSIGRTYY